MKSNLKVVLIKHEGKTVEAEVKSEYLKEGSSYLALATEENKELLHLPLDAIKEVKETNDDSEEQSFMQKMGMVQDVLGAFDDMEKAIAEEEQERAINLEHSVEIEQLDWEKAEAHLMASKKKYEEARQGQFGLEKRIMPLVKRLENEERSTALYEAIMNL